ncbi:MAG: DeoR/GlpR transcriptional regulator [Eubacteriales bacterium]|nr:DeoR/GlpR transcriptional regulator [Eubacteriales bacterium]
MPREHRIERINEFVAAKKEVSLAEIFEMFPEVSTMTVRRDLEILEQRGTLMRLRGKVRAITKQFKFREESYNLRAKENVDGKKIIASKAMKYIQRGCSMFFDAGTTSMALAECIGDGDYFILTSGPNIALELIKKEGVNVIMTGGHMDRDFLNVTGANAMALVDSINIDIAFLTPSGFSVDGHFTVGNADHAELKKVIIKKAHTVVMLMDATKLDKNLPYTFARMEDIDVLICDKPLPDIVVREALKNDVTVV